MVGTGLSFPYVALYNNEGGTITYANGMKLGRGVEMSYEAETSDSNIFYADNREAEIVGGRFLSGTLTAEIDGLETAAKKLVYGLGDASRTVTVGQETVELLGMQGAEPLCRPSPCKKKQVRKCRMPDYMRFSCCQKHRRRNASSSKRRRAACQRNSRG